MPITAHVFLDTQLFVANNFDFGRTSFKELIVRVREGRVRVFLTSVTIGEVKRRIQVQVKEAANKFHEVRKHLRILANSNVPEISARSERLDSGAVTEELSNQFDDFLKAANVSVIDCSKVDPEAIFKKYFALQLPFEEKQDKRHEFPDAFSIEALRDYSKSKGKDILVITGDKGFRAVSEQYGMTVLETVEQFLAKENSEWEPRITEHVLKCFADSVDEITRQIRQAFDVSGFELIDEDGVVNRTELTELELDDDPFVIRIEGNSAILEVSVHLEYDANVSYDDPLATHYDKEEGRTYVFNTIHRTIEEEADFSLEVKVEFHPDMDSYCRVSIGKLNDGEDFEVTTSDNYY